MAKPQHTYLHIFGVLVLAVGVALILAPRHTIAPPRQTQAHPTVAPRTTHVGIALGTNPSPDIEHTYDTIAQVADTVVLNGTWSDWISHDYYSTEVAAARRRGMKIYAYLDILGYIPNPRQHIDTPPSLNLSGDFENNQVRSSYTQLIKTIAQRDKPDYMITLVEANIHKHANPASYAAYVSMYPDLVATIKALSPSTQVAVSNFYSIRTDQDRQTFAQDIADTDEYSDLLAVSTYPIFSFTENNLSPHPGQLPENFVADMAGYSQHPLSIAETGWPSHSFGISLNSKKQTVNASPQDQAEYIKRLQASVQLAQQSEHPVENVNYVALADPDPLACNIIKLRSPSLEWFCYLGLTDSRGTTKSAFNALVEWNK